MTHRQQPQVRVVDAVAEASIDFRFERGPVLRPAGSDLAGRRPVWLALSDRFLDTDVNLFREGNVRTLAASPYSMDELDTILREEVYPVCSFNASSAAVRRPGPGGGAWDATWGWDG